MASTDDKETGRGRSSWKSRLTEQQLKRKRLADRESQRESRNNARRTISKLEEQLQLLTSGRADTLTSQLLESNAQLEALRDSYKTRLDGVYSALEMTKEEIESVDRQGSRSSSQQPDPSRCRIPRPVIKPKGDAELQVITRRADYPMDGIMDARMLLGQLSPFAQICMTIQDTVRPPKFSDDEFLEAMILWKQSSPAHSSVWNLASQLYHIDLAPSVMTASSLYTGIRSPTFFHDVIEELSPTNVTDVLSSLRDATNNRNTLSEPPPSSIDEVGRKKREVILCALEATRFWTYNSKVERLAMFWAVYRITTLYYEALTTRAQLLIFPTAQNLAKCPSWYRPVPSQCSHPHPSFVDFIPWPLIRDRLVHTFEHYQKTNLMSKVVGNLEMDRQWKLCKRPLITINAAYTDLVLDSAFETSLHNLHTLAMKDDFVNQFPELALYVYRSHDRSKASMYGLEPENVKAIGDGPGPKKPSSWRNPGAPGDTSMLYDLDGDGLLPEPNAALDAFLYDTQGNMDAFFGAGVDMLPVECVVTPFPDTSEGYFVV